MEVEGSGGVPGFAMLVGKDKILGAGERIISAASLAVEVLTHTITAEFVEGAFQRWRWRPR